MAAVKVGSGDAVILEMTVVATQEMKSEAK
jgi:hypothetical protein